MTTRTVKAAGTKTGEKDGRGWTLYSLEFTDGLKAQTFDAALGGLLKVGTTWDVEIAKDGKFNNIASASPSTAPAIPETTPGQPANVPPEVWDAKDRALDMQSAYKSTAHLFSEQEGIMPDEVIGMARWIYQDIQDARAGRRLRPADAYLQDEPLEEPTIVERSESKNVTPISQPASDGLPVDTNAQQNQTANFIVGIQGATTVHELDRLEKQIDDSTLPPGDRVGLMKTAASARARIEKSGVKTASR